MRYVVTGGAGFIGSHLVEHLVTAGQHVTVLDDFSTGRRENLAPWAERIELVEGSVTDPDVCHRALRGADYVLHQAALPSVPRSLKDPIASHAANATGTLNVLVAARDARVTRVVYAASSSAYGNTAELPKREDMIPRPLSPYAVAKLAGEQYCRAFHASFGLGTVALRYFNVFGPRQDPNSQYAAVIPKFIVCAQVGDSPVIYGDGEQTRDFTYVANVVRANLLACEAPPAALGEVYNVGCGERVSVNTLWRRIRAMLGSTVNARYEPARAGDVRDSLASLDRARALLGYETMVSLDDGLRETVRALANALPSAAIAAAVPGR
ncbi:MAG TPA: SDR family oxidoreductase [Gemmatimonadaceae bacterium]|jgi:nucleoside-diphosphate-sugar epimerase